MALAYRLPHWFGAAAFCLVLHPGVNPLAREPKHLRTEVRGAGILPPTVITMASSNEMEMDPLQISSTSASDEAAAMQAQDVSFGLSVVPSAKQSSGSDSSPRASSRPASEGREVVATSNRPSRASSPYHRNKVAPKPKHMYACEVAKPKLPMPAGIPTTYGPSQEVHLHKHQQLGVIVQGVDPQVHSHALAQAQIVESQAAAFASEVQQQAQCHVQSRVQAIEQQAQAVVSEVSNEASKQLAIANETIANLRYQNEALARQQQDLYSQIATLQNMVAEVKATAVNTSVPQIPQTQNGAEITEALKAMATHVGQTMNELKDAVLSGSASSSPKAKGRKNRSKDSDSSADRVPIAKAAKAPYISNPPPYTCERRPPLMHDTWACPPPSSFACGRLPTSSSSANASPVFTTPFASLRPAVGKAPFSAVGIGVGLASTAAQFAGPPGPPPPAPPEVFNIGDPDEGEEEEQVEDDPVIEPRVDDDGDAQGGAAVDDGDYEGATYRYKDLKDLKLPQLPKDSVGFRSWRNALLTQFAAIDRTGQARILRWLQICVRPEVTNIEIAFFQNNPEQLPRLDSYLASQLSDARHMKGEFGLEVQAYIERAHSHGVLPSARAMLAMLSRRFRVDRVRGATVTQQTLLAITLDGFSYSQMQTFKERVEYVLNGIAPEHWPSDETLFSWFYAKIKASRGMQRVIDKVKDSSPTSRRRTFAWLWEQFSDHLAELREDANERDFREAMLKETKVDTRPVKEKAKSTAAAATKAAAAVPPPKKKSPPQPPPAPAKQEGKGDGKGKSKGKGKGKDKAKEKSKAKGPPAKTGGGGAKAKPTVPCIFFPKGTCNRGADCPFSHEVAPANTAKKGSGSASSAAAKTSAAVALVMPGSASASACNPRPARSHVATGLSAAWRFLTRWVAMFSTIAFPSLAPSIHNASQLYAPAAPALLSMPAGARVHSSEGNTYDLEWIADSGAGRSLASIEALKAQGIFLDERLCCDDETIVFETGNGKTTSGSVLYTSGSTFGDSRSYMLPNCPVVRSMGEIVSSGMPFLWMPGKLPMFLQSSDAIQYSLDASKVLEAHKVEDHVPIFRESIQVHAPGSSAFGFPIKKLMADAKSYTPSPNITMDSTLYDLMMDPGVPSKTAAGSRDPDPHPEEEPAPLPPPSEAPPDAAKAPPKPPPVAPKARKSKPVAKSRAVAEPDEAPAPVVKREEQADDEDEEEEPLSKEQRLRREAATIQHQMSHYPKNPTCPICQRSRMYKKRTTKVRTDPLEDRGSLDPVTAFGERIATDFIIVRKLKDGRENSVQVVRDEFSGWLRAYPIATRDTDSVVRNLLTFLGPSYRHPCIMCKSDQAPEIVAACKRLGFVHEDSLENRFPHNAQLERDIRTLEEIARSSHLSAGFEMIPDLWMHSVNYAATVLNAFQVPAGKDETRHRLATGDDFNGRKLLLGQLVHYRVDPSQRGKFDASSRPGLFAGYRYDAGPKSYRNVFFVLDYQRLKDKSPGYELPVAVPTEELWVDDTQDPVLPLRAAAEQALANFKEAQLETVVPLDLPFASIDGTTSVTDRNAYITLERVLKFGATPSCRACKFEGGKHTPACRARFNSLIRADKISKTPKAPPSVSEEVSRPPKPSDSASSTPAPHTSDPAPVVGTSASQGSGGSDGIEPGMIARIRDDIDEAFIMQDKAINRARRLASATELPGQDTLFEYACSHDSNLSDAAKGIGVNSIRLSFDTVDLLNKQHVEQLHGQVEQLKGADLWFALPCSPHCQLQSKSNNKGGAEYKRHLRAEHKRVADMLALAVPVFQTVISNSGRIAIEWPRHFKLWELPLWQQFEQRNGLRRVYFDGCSLGLTGKHYPIHKPSCVSTNSLRLIQYLSQHQCDHSHIHESVEGSSPEQAGHYPAEMLQVICEALYPSRFFKRNSAIPFARGLVTQNLPKKVWLQDTKALDAVRKEAEGLRSNNTWSDESATLVSELRSNARRAGRTIKIAELLTLCGIKHYELSPECHKYKGRIVYRGDYITDESHNIVLFEETATTPTALTALNLTLWFGCLKKHTTTCSDAVQAFLQAPLSEETWAILPWELWTPSMREKFPATAKIAVKLLKSLYGHPLAGRLWQDHLAAALEALGGVEVAEHPSNWLFRLDGHVLILNIYVDDLTLAGHASLHSRFWQLLREKIKLEPEAEVLSEGIRILGRLHRVHRTDDGAVMSLDMSSYAQQVVELYSELAGVEKACLKTVPTPCLAESAMTDDDLLPGAMQPYAAKVLMKALWLARLSRPDIYFVVTRLASFVSRWTKWHDKVMHRLISYLHAHPNLCMQAAVAYDQQPSLHVYTDADFGSCPFTAKSTSGILIAVETGAARFPVYWSSRKQQSVARSTPEAEAIAMSGAMFSEAINVQTFLQHLLSFNVPTTYHQDNEAVIRILASGYSAKLRHAGRVHRINIAAMSEQLAYENVSAIYCHTHEQIANGFTKAIPPAEWSHMLQQLGMHTSTALAARPAEVDQAEALAGTQPHRLTNQHVVHLLSFLPKDSVTRNAASDSAHSFIVGAFVHGGVVGIRDRTYQYPQVTALLCRYVRQFKTAQPFSTIALFEGLDASLHRDSHNHPSVPNLVIQLSSGKGPVLWVESEDGDVPCPKGEWSLKGHLLNSPALFDARRWHCSVINDRVDKRIMLVAFCIRNVERLSADRCNYLQKLGFQLP